MAEKSGGITGARIAEQAARARFSMVIGEEEHFTIQDPVGTLAANMRDHPGVDSPQTVADDKDDEE